MIYFNKKIARKPLLQEELQTSIETHEYKPLKPREIEIMKLKAKIFDKYYRLTPVDDFGRKNRLEFEFVGLRINL